jgi:putative flippase GtrA
MIRRELAIFLVVGSLTVLVDFSIYRGLLWSTGLGVGVAKGTGFLAGTVFAYVANRLWTFGQHRHEASSAWRFAVLYGATLLANVAVNALVLRMAGDAAWAVQGAFLVATGVSATLNFLGMKLYVFRPSTAEHASS